MAGEALTVSDPYQDALSRKAGAFAAILEITRGQDEVLGKDDPEALLSLLGRKKELLHRIEGIDRDLAAARPSAPDARSEALLGEIRRTLEALLACEEETKRRVEGMKRETSDELARIHQGRRAAEIYRRQRPGGSAVDREE